MSFTKKFKDIKKLFTIIFLFILFINTTFLCNLHAVSFKVSEIEISEDFDLNFDKTKVFDKAFIKAFDQMTSIIITSDDKKKIGKTSLSTVKSLIDSFNISEEKFINEKYIVLINVNFNKKNTYEYFSSKNIFPSIPNKIDLLILPVLIDVFKEDIILFSENPLYKNWNKETKKYHLLNYILPSEDIEDAQIIKTNISNIEKYEFNEIIKKYDLNNHIIVIIYKNANEMNVLSRLNLNNVYKIFASKHESINFNDENSLDKFIYKLKTYYEDEWKSLNLINTSIKLPITITLPSKQYSKIQLFEKVIENLDLVSNYQVQSFNNKKIYYKIVYNGSPNKFINEMLEKGIIVKKKNQTWEIE